MSRRFIQGKELDQPAQPIFDTTPVVKKPRGHPLKVLVVVLAVAPADMPIPTPAAVEEGILMEEPILALPQIAPASARVPSPVPAPPKIPTPPVMEERPAPPAPTPTPVPASVLSRSQYGRERKALEHYGGIAVAAYFASAPFPRSYRETVIGSDKTKWEQAMDRELKSIKDNKVWTLVPRPNVQKVVDSRWVLKIKDDGLYKVRFCAKGYAQQYGVDYVDTFAPVAKYTSVRILFAIAAGLGLKVHQMDVVTEFLYGYFQDTVYVEQLEGYEVPGHEDWVYLLKRVLYGLKQSPLVWYDNIKAVLRGFEFVRCKSDHGIFVTIRNGYRVYLAVYVDDLLVMGQRTEDIKEVKDLLKKRYKMKDLGLANRFLGMDIVYEENGAIELHLKQVLLGL
jgi:hypothetical protein